MFGTEPQKFNHVQLIRDLRGEDPDIRIFALRTIIQLERANLRSGVGALEKLEEVIRAGAPSWGEEIGFYCQRALERLESIRRSLEEPQEELADEDAPIVLEELDEDDERVVVRCLKRIEAQEYTPARDPVRRLLKSTTDPLVLAAVLSALAAVGEGQDLFEIKRLGEHANGRVRATCVDAIATLAEREVARQMLEPFLQDRDGAVRARAVLHLGEGDWDVVAAAVEAGLASDQVSDRAALAEAMGRIRADQAHAVIKRLSEDPEEAVRSKLLEAVTRGDHPQKLYVCQKLRKDPSDAVRRVAAEALKHHKTMQMLAMGGFDMKGPVGSNKPMTSLEELAEREEIDPIDLADLKDDDHEVRMQCLYRIRQRAHEPAHAAVLELLGVTEDSGLLAETLRCLTVIGTGRDVDAISHFLANPDPTVRAAAVEALEQVATPSQQIVMIVPLFHDPDPVPAGAASRNLLRHEQAVIEQHLGAMLRHEAPGLRARALAFLARFDGPRVRVCLEQGTRDPDPNVRLLLAGLDLPMGETGDSVLAVLEMDAIEPIRAQAAKNRVARERRSVRGGEEARPGLEALRGLAEERAAIGEAAARQRAEQAKEAAAEARARAAGEAGVDKSAMDAFVNRLSAAQEEEREILMARRDMLREALGKKLFQMIKRKQASNPAFDRYVFVIEKYLHIEKNRKKEAEKEVGLWGALKSFTGMDKGDADVARQQETLRRSYVDLGKTAMDLKNRENVLFGELHMEYMELDSAEDKLADFD